MLSVFELKYNNLCDSTILVNSASGILTIYLNVNSFNLHQIHVVFE